MLCDLRVGRTEPPPDSTHNNAFTISIPDQYELLDAFNPSTLTHLDISHILHANDVEWGPQITFPNMQHMKISFNESRHVIPILGGIVPPRPPCCL